MSTSCSTVQLVLYTVILCLCDLILPLQARLKGVMWARMVVHRKKNAKTFHYCFAVCLTRATTVRSKGRNLRIKAPMCRALKKLCDPDGEHVLAHTPNMHYTYKLNKHQCWKYTTMAIMRHGAPCGRGFGNNNSSVWASGVSMVTEGAKGGGARRKWWRWLDLTSCNLGSYTATHQTWRKKWFLPGIKYWNPTACLCHLLCANSQYTWVWLLSIFMPADQLSI